MSTNYAKSLPRDTGGDTMQEYPTPNVALARYGVGVSVSSVITLTDNTSTVEVGVMTAASGGAVIKWIAASDTTASVIASGATANFDHFIPAGQVRRFVVPIETQGTASIVGINKQAGLYNRLAWAPVTTAVSVFGAEY